MRSALPILIVVLAGCSGISPAGQRIYTREEFRKEFLGATLDEVRAKLGAPDETNVPESWWTYRKRTRNAKTGKVDDEVTLEHVDGRVVSIGPPPE